LSLGCDFDNLPWTEEKHMKQAVSDLGYKCSPTETSGDIHSPMIVVSDANDVKGTCYFPADIPSLSCDAPAEENTRRLCYCTEKAVTAQPYQPKWPHEWVFPAGEGQPVAEYRYEACACYATKSGVASTMPPEKITKESEYDEGNGAYSGACASSCNKHEGGPYHAADLHLLGDWSTGRPCIIVVHGSGGSKDEQYTQMMAKKFADAGFIVLSLNYNAATCETDIGAAVEYMRTVGEEHLGVDPNSIALYGWSQGGRCVYKAGYKNLMVPHQSVKAVIDMSGCGGKGPLNDVDKSVTIMPPPLLLAHAENDNTIKINDCHKLVDHAKKKKWAGGTLLIKELYFKTGGHNLLKSSDTEPQVVDEIFNHLFQYLGRPCKRDKKKGILGEKPMDNDWPTCKSKEGESVDRCGGFHQDCE